MTDAPIAEEDRTQIRVLIIPTDPTEALRVETITPDLTTLHAVIGGDIEGIGGDGWSAYVHEEGKILGLAVNVRATRLARVLGWRVGDVLTGPVLLSGPPTDRGADTEVPGTVLDAAADLGFFGEGETT